ncbi:MAG: hypothetical protein GDA56_11710 [Hormoscilla sp. GM7CHS1pb]|nr:hypothetical protein [Hormoscilla sp. GM7CHS1pb]
MTQVDREYKTVFSRIPEIVADKLKSDRLFDDLDKNEMIKQVSITLEKYLSPEQLLAIDEVELTQCSCPETPTGWVLSDTSGSSNNICLLFCRNSKSNVSTFCDYTPPCFNSCSSVSTVFT